MPAGLEVAGDQKENDRNGTPHALRSSGSHLFHGAVDLPVVPSFGVGMEAVLPDLLEDLRVLRRVLLRPGHPQNLRQILPVKFPCSMARKASGASAKGRTRSITGWSPF